jgi:hypothetical protein
MRKTQSPFRNTSKTISASNAIQLMAVKTVVVISYASLAKTAEQMSEITNRQSNRYIDFL